ncbi:hypothetical protein ACFQL7_27885 [Halocatena marina]|uniref:Uncharacterized protein n=1 Tax=Halocatena marina TaxID=2934937 RepID=A0ABD5YYL7_9EURY
MVRESLGKAARDDQIITESVKKVRSRLLEDSPEQEIENTTSEKTADAEHHEGTTTKGDRYLDEYDPQEVQTNGTGKRTGAEPAGTDDQKQEQEAEATEESSNSVAKSEDESGLDEGSDATEEETTDAEMQEDGTNKGDRYLDEYATKDSQSNNTGKYVEEDTGKSV